MNIQSYCVNYYLSTWFSANNVLTYPPFLPVRSITSKLDIGTGCGCLVFALGVGVGVGCRCSYWAMCSD